jgi:hypothetical protein
MKTLRALLRFLAVILVLLVGCADGPVAPVNKELRLQVSYGSQGPVQTIWAGGSIYESRLIGFDIRNYPAVDSIVLACRVVNERPDASIRLRLFNITDSAVVAGSELHGEHVGSKMLYSSNLRGAFPNHPVDLALQLKLDSLNGPYTGSEGSFLILYDL